MEKFSELFSAFDYIDEIIYICDMDTYDLVYCNQKTKDHLLSEYKENERGYKCYKCLQNLDYPCVFCNNEVLKKQKRCIWTRKNPHVDKYYLLHDSVITIQGKEYRMELAVDATHMEEAAAHTRQMLDMENHLTDCVRHLVKSGDFSDSVMAVLQTVLNYYSGERAYLFDFDWEERVSNNTYEICAPGIQPEIDNLQNVPVENMHFWTEIFQKQSAVIIEDLEALKDDPDRQQEYHDLSKQGISSIIAVPLFTEEKLMGFLGVDNPKNNFGNSEFLLNLVYFIGNEIRKNHMVMELQDSSYRDALTGVYNRQGFQHVTEKWSENHQAIGFAVVDIDNFKMINDTYGHDTGDVLLQEIASILVSMFRNEDTVFRLGGDEFAVLLYNCDSTAWKTICSKIQWIHSAMAEKHRNMPVTISVGICFSEKKYNDEIYRLADQALYETKRNGRAGCTMIDESTGEKRHWNDDSLSSFSRSVLEFNSTGLFRIEYPLEHQEKPRMICSDMVREMFSFSADADPETCYQMWVNGIEPSYLEALEETRRQLMQSVQAECTYQWNHPKLGIILVRTIGIGEVVDGIQILRGYHHSMKDTKIIERADESKLLLEAISSIYFGSYYINLEKDTYSTIKKAANERFLQVEEGDAGESLKNFVSILVREQDQEKMNSFIDLETLPKRMEQETHLDCEYVSMAEKGWRRATFIPVKYDADGKITHVLFEVSPLDMKKAQESEENLQNKKNIESLYHHVPGGLVMYEWDGKQLKTLQISKFYEEQYGDTLVSKHGENIGGPDFSRIHPDDLENYQKAIREALTKTHHLEYVYRAWNNIQRRYVWVKLNAVSEEQENGTSLVYAMYSDVTGQKEAELRLRKKQASLVAALSASNQLCYEYDPKTHVQECLTEDHIFHLPRVIKDYPESILEIVHPDDGQLFLDTIYSMNEGKTEASCNIRLRRDGKYVWYSYQLQSFYDSEKERIVVILSIMDNSEHVMTVQNYKARMQMLMGVTEEALSFGTINLTDNTFQVVHAQSGMRAITEQVKTLDELFQTTVLQVVGSKHQEEYRKLFSRDNLLALMEKGQMHVTMEHLYQMTPTHIEWVCTCVDMLKNPSTGDVMGVCYSKSVQDAKITSMLLEKTLQRDYPLAAVVYRDSDEYYLFNAEKGEYCVHKQDFWENITENMEDIVDRSLLEQVKNTLTKEKVLGLLEQRQEFYYAFDSDLQGETGRLEAGFNYLDDNHEMLLATLRNITDSVIMERLRHDNERDHLTNLYNRRKTFAVCRKLLQEHPEDQFAMLHFDIKHFRLYNTFFGDTAGDKLLCDIANMFRNMDSDYEYWAYGRIESDVFCVFFPINQNKYQKHLHDLLHGLYDYRSDFLIEPAIGIYTVTNREMSIESMFTRASIAAKTVRSGVTNSVIFYDESMEQNMSDEQQVVNEMQTAIEKEQFQVYLQPKYSLRTNKPVGAEALVRWIHPQKGLISPAKFIPVFERNGFIAVLDRFMWEHVCQLLRKWQDEGYEPAPVSVNVSRISMYSPTTIQFLKDLVRKYQIDPKYLELELTESAYMDDPMEMKKQLRELQEFGFHILMDDFGSGYSSLNTLRELPVDCLKLDMKFLSESSTDERGRLVLASVVRMSKLLKLSIIAEGVETLEQAEFLRGLGCEYVQGYLFARPMPVESYEQMLTLIQGEAAARESVVQHGAEQSTENITHFYSLDEALPVPMAMAEYTNNTFVYIQSDPLFLEEFGLEADLRKATSAFQNHLDEKNYAVLLRAFDQCAETKKTVSFKLCWTGHGMEPQEYVCRAAYEGEAGGMVTLLVVFTNITKLDVI